MKTKIIAHRGASNYAPENTMPAFRIAYHMGADGIETDVQLTKDQVPILIHDEQLNRTTNGKGLVKDYTWQELKSMDAGTWFSETYTGIPIVKLENLLQWIKDKSLYLNIELKNNKIEYKHIESIVFEQLEFYQYLNRTTVSTFNPQSIKRMKRLSDEVEIALLTSKRRRNLVNDAYDLGANALHVKYQLLNEALVHDTQQKKMPLRIYTVNRIKRMLYCYQLKCDGIFTDVPDKAIEAKTSFYNLTK